MLKRSREFETSITTEGSPSSSSHCGVRIPATGSAGRAARGRRPLAWRPPPMARSPRPGGSNRQRSGGCFDTLRGDAFCGSTRRFGGYSRHGCPRAHSGPARAVATDWLTPEWSRRPLGEQELARRGSFGTLGRHEFRSIHTSLGNTDRISCWAARKARVSITEVI